MSKTLTTYEALKANETKRVRGARAPKDVDGFWFGVRELIEHCNRGGLMDFDSNRCLEWEAEEPLIERWAIVTEENVFITSYTSESDVVRYRNQYYPRCRIVHLREVRP